MNGENPQRRNAFALAISSAVHLIFLGMVINQSSIPYDLPAPPPAPEPPVPAMEVEIVRFPPPPVPRRSETTPEPTPPQPPLAWPHPERMRVLPPLPPTPTPTPTPAPTPQPAPAPAAPPLVAAAAPAPVAPPVQLRKLTLAQRKLIEAAAQAASAAPVARPAPLGALNIHVPAVAPPAGVPTLPLAGAPAARLAGGAAKGGAGASGGGAGGQRGVGLSPFPYGYMPSGGSGLRGTLVGCANAEAVHLSAAERDRCNERFGVEIGAAPKLDPIAGSRQALDRAAAREAREQKYRNSTTDMNHDPSLPGGIAGRARLHRDLQAQRRRSQVGAAMRAIPAILACVAGVSTASASAQSTIRPGLWESHERVDAPITQDKTERRCVTRAQIARFMSCYLNHHYKCVCPDETIGGGRIRYRGRCVDAHGQVVTIAGEGAFTATTLKLAVHPAFRFLGLPIQGEASVEAHWLSDACPAGAAGQ